MKANRLTGAAFLVLFVSLSIHAVTAQTSCGDEAVLNLFSPYSPGDALRYVAYSHACRQPLDRHHLIFYSSWFLEGNPKVAMQTRINERGMAESVRSVFDWAEQGFKSKQLTEEDAAAIAKTIGELPESSKTPPLEFLYVVSFKNHGEWITRVYDRRHLPAAITKVHSISGYFLNP